MSDSFQMLVDPVAALQDAERLAYDLVTRFQEVGLLGELDASAALGCRGHRPGARINDLYRRAVGELSFWTLRTCGVETRIGRQINELALGPAFERITCPACLTRYEEMPQELESEVMDALEGWLGNSSDISVTCPGCQAAPPITDWDVSPPIGFSNLALVFWNWPPLDALGWRVDIRRLAAAQLGHRVVLTHGRI